MKFDCDVIRDLLPLYADDACSGKSREAVEEHLRDCPDCRGMLDRLRKTELESDLQSEKGEVIRYGAKRFRRRSAAVGSVIAGVFMIPILVCLVINVASGPSLDWFYIVLASLCVAAALIIVPLMVPEDKAFWTFCAFCVSLVFLLAVVCRYSRGNWFWIASGAALFGLAAVFLPFVVKARPVRELLGGASRPVVVLGVDAALFVNMMNMIAARNRFTFNNVLLGLGVLAGFGLVVMEILRKRGNGK